MQASVLSWLNGLIVLYACGVSLEPCLLVAISAAEAAGKSDTWPAPDGGCWTEASEASYRIAEKQVKFKKKERKKKICKSFHLLSFSQAFQGRAIHLHGSQILEERHSQL